MSSKRFHDLRHTLAFRLTLWYAAIFSLCSFAVFLLFYFQVDFFIHNHAQEELLSDFREYINVYRLKGFEELKSDMIIEVTAEGEDRIFFRLLTHDGSELALSNMVSWRGAGIDRSELARLEKGQKPVTKMMSITGRQHKIAVLYGFLGPDLIIQIGKSLEEDERFLNEFRQIFGVIGILIIGLAAVFGWFMARRALSGLQEVTRTAVEISGGDFKRRVPLKRRGEEIDRLALTFNGMLDRIQSLMAGMREITDNIAHDLKSPITRIRGIAEMTLTSGRSREEYETMAAGTIEECDRLLAMINTMLDISETETGTSALKMEEVDMARLSREAVEIFEVLGEEKGIAFVMDITSDCPVYGDRQLLQRLVSNLIDNAVKYTPAGGTITVSVAKDEKGAVLSVADTGIGIEPQEIQHLFERFYRCDKSRSQPGVGLGLALVRAIVLAHGGKIDVKSQPGEGAVFIVTLPFGQPAH